MFLSFLYSCGSYKGEDMNFCYNFLIFSISAFFSSYASLAIRLFSSIRESKAGWSSFWMSDNIPLNLTISSSYYFSRASLGSKFMIGTFVMYLAREAYFRVERVYS